MLHYNQLIIMVTVYPPPILGLVSNPRSQALYGGVASIVASDGQRCVAQSAAGDRWGMVGAHLLSPPFGDSIYIYITLWLFNIAMENGPFIDDFPIKTSIHKGFSMAMLNNQMVCIYSHGYLTSSYFTFGDSSNRYLPSGYD